MRYLITLLCITITSLRAGPAIAQPTQPAASHAAEIRLAGTVRVATYNVQNWRHSFVAHELRARAATQPAWPREFVDLINRERIEDAEDNWEVARVLTILQPDVLFLQEAPNHGDLAYFNQEFLGGYFQTVHVFPSNTTREQNLALMVRPGFKVIEFREGYHQEPDTAGVNTEKTGLLFARGPAFALIESPTGQQFWAGTNHFKSKADNSVPVTLWRNAEARRAHEIIQELRRAGPDRVILIGDMNDEIGFQEFEQEAGGSALETLLGSGDDALVLATRPLAEAGQISFHGGRLKRRQSFIDHAVVTPELAATVVHEEVFTADLADVASDHYPVVVDLQLP